MDPAIPETREEWRARHVRRAEADLAVLRASGLRFSLRESPDGLLGATLLLREPGRPKIDFYVSTGRWRVVGSAGGTTRGGGAERLLAWYRKQTTEVR